MASGGTQTPTPTHIHVKVINQTVPGLQMSHDRRLITIQPITIHVYLNHLYTLVCQNTHSTPGAFGALCLTNNVQLIG